MTNFEQVTQTLVLANTAKTATFNTTGFNISGFLNNLAVTQLISTTGGTSPTLDSVVAVSADDTTYVSVATFGQVTTSTGTGICQTQYVDNRTASAKFIRLTGTIAGTSPTFNVSVLIQGMKSVT